MTGPRNHCERTHDVLVGRRPCEALPPKEQESRAQLDQFVTILHGHRLWRKQGDIWRSPDTVSGRKIIFVKDIDANLAVDQSGGHAADSIRPILKVGIG